MLRSWNLESYISDYTLKVIKVASICSAKITLLWNLTLLLWWWLLFVFSFSGWGNCMRLVWSGEQEGRQCLRVPPAPHILVFLIFFFLPLTLSGRVQQLLCAMVVVIFFWVPGWGLGQGIFFQGKDWKLNSKSVFGGLECFTTWVKDGKFLLCKSEFYAQWAKDCMTLVANFTASC